MRDAESRRDMRRLVIGLVGAAVILGACSSSSKPASKQTTTTTAAASTTVAPSTTSTPERTTTSAASATTTSTVACPNTGASAPVTTPASQVPALLTGIAVTSAGCKDNVVFSYRLRGTAPPSCTIGYRAGPFTQDGSGAPVAVAGAAFVVVRCSPAYAYDFENGKTTFGPKRFAGFEARYAREVVKTGDNEGVLTWVIGLSARRPFAVTATGTPSKQLTIAFS